MLNSLNTHPQSLGGKTMAIRQRQIAEQKYFEKPNICLYCNKIISIENKKITEIRKKKFCDHSCSIRYYHSNNIKIKTCQTCKKETSKNIKKCLECKEQENILYLFTTKKSLFSRCKNWQSARSTIQKMARKIFKNSNKPKQCNICKYNKHYEVCHIKSVSSFNEDSTLLEINAIENLIALCPTHHWEFDNKILKLGTEAGLDPLMRVYD